MSSELLKYILWALLCIPVVAAAIILTTKLFSDAYTIQKKRSEKAAKIKAKKEKMQEIQKDFKEFEAEYTRRKERKNE